MTEPIIQRRGACLMQAELCRKRAEADGAFRRMWLSEALKWERRADEDLEHELSGETIGATRRFRMRPWRRKK